MGCKHGKVNWLKCIIFVNHYTIFFNLRLEFDLPIGCQDATNLPNWVFDLHHSIQFLYIAILLCNSHNVLLELINLLWHSHVFFINFHQWCIFSLSCQPLDGSDFFFFGTINGVFPIPSMESWPVCLALRLSICFQTLWLLFSPLLLIIQ
jgi:hypothetical protein